MPGDAAIGPISPANGATVPANRSGIDVAYRCPPYTVAAYDDGNGNVQTDPGEASDYRVRFARSATLGADGRLASGQFGSDAGARPGTDDATTCASTLDTPDSSASPEIVGGRVFWQAYRYCTGCPSGWEAGPVLSFVVRPSISATLTLPGRVYSGHLTTIAVHISDPLSGADVRLQRRARGSWITFATKRFHARYTKLVAKLPAGRLTIRAQVVTKTVRLVVATRAVTVRAGGAGA